MKSNHKKPDFSCFEKIPVLMYCNKTNTLLAEYSSIGEAKRDNGICGGSVSSNLRSNSTRGLTSRKLKQKVYFRVKK